MRLLLAPGAGTAYSAALPGTSSGAGSLRKQLVSTPEFREPVCLEQQEHIPQDAAVGRRATKVNTDSWQGQDHAVPHSIPGVLLRGLRLAFWKKALVALAHRSAGLALRKDVLDLGLAAREIAISW